MPKLNLSFGMPCNNKILGEPVIASSLKSRVLILIDKQIYNQIGKLT